MKDQSSSKGATPMKIKVDGREYEAIAMVNPNLYPLSFAKKSLEYYLRGKRGANYTLTQWKSGVWSLMNMNCEYRDHVKVEVA